MKSTGKKAKSTKVHLVEQHQQQQSKCMRCPLLSFEAKRMRETDLRARHSL